MDINSFYPCYAAGDSPSKRLENDGGTWYYLDDSGAWIG